MNLLFKTFAKYFNRVHKISEGLQVIVQIITGGGLEPPRGGEADEPSFAGSVSATSIDFRPEKTVFRECIFANFNFRPIR